MNADYKDITSRIKEKPKWWDENGTPRYDPFSPELCPDIYAEEVELLEIACQSCGERFLVEMHHSKLDAYPINKNKPKESFTERLEKNPDYIPHYGDPPRHTDESEYQHSGNVMNCIDIQIVQLWKKGWRKGESGEWVRIK